MSFFARLFRDTRTDADDPHRERTIREDESGAVMIIGVFMAVFLVGMLYYLVGLSDAIVFRERMQDSSDAGAFAAAVTNARGMNFIALLNIIMSAVMAVVLALKIIEIIIIASLAIAAVVGFFCGGCTAPAVSMLTTMQRAVNRANQVVERIAKVIINVAHVAQKGIRLAFPLASQARAIEMMSSGTFTSGGVRGPSQVGGAFPLYGTLPTEDHVFKETCDRASIIVGEIVAAPFGAIPVIGGRVQDYIAGAVGSLVRAYANYYCGGGEAPTPSFREDVPRPATPEFEACRTGCQPSDRPGAPPLPGECRDCEGATGGVGDEACNEAINRLCHEASEQANFSGPAYCPPGDRGVEGCRGSSDPGRDLPGGSGIVHFRGCDDPRRARAEVLTYPGATPPSAGGRADAPDEMGACTRRVRDATRECQTGRARGFQYGLENVYYVYWHNIIGDQCRIESTYLGRENLTPEQLDYQVMGDDGDADDRPNSIPFCMENVEGVRGWGEVGPNPSHPWKASCQYRMPENYVDYPPSSGSSVLMRDPTSPQYQSVCRALPRNYEESVSAIPRGTPGGSPTLSGGGGSFWRGRIVREVFGCVTEEDIAIDVTIGERPAEGEWKPPQRMCEFTGGEGLRSFARTSCADGPDEIYHGAAEFQMRAMAFGRGFESQGDAGMEVATWRRGGDDRGTIGRWSTRGYNLEVPTASRFRSVGRLSISQAEYFWDQDENWDDTDEFLGGKSLNRGSIEWLWDMSWRARLRRIHMSEAVQAEAGGAVPGGFSVTGVFNKIFAH